MSPVLRDPNSVIGVRPTLRKTICVVRRELSRKLDLLNVSKYGNSRSRVVVRHTPFGQNEDGNIHNQTFEKTRPWVKDTVPRDTFRNKEDSRSQSVQTQIRR